MTDINIPHRVYQPRGFSDLGTFTHQEWRLKTAGIDYNLALPRPELVSATETVAVDVLPSPAVTDSHYGVGFLGVHDGQNFCFVYVDWWANQNELIHRPFLAPLDEPTNLRPAETSEVGACVWDIALIAHERQAWIETVLDNPDGPDPDAYLTRVSPACTDSPRPVNRSQQNARIRPAWTTRPHSSPRSPSVPAQRVRRAVYRTDGSTRDTQSHRWGWRSTPRAWRAYAAQ